MISVESANKTTDVRVEARGTAIPENYRNNNWNNNNNRLQTIDLRSHTAKVSFVSTKDVGLTHTGLITDIDTKDKEIQFVGKEYTSYKGASFKNQLGNSIDQDTFEKQINRALDNGEVYEATRSKDGDKITVSIIGGPYTAPVSLLNQQAVTAAAKEITEKAEVVFPKTGLVSEASVTLPTSTKADVAWTSSNSDLLSITAGVAKVAKVTEDKTVTLTATVTKGEAKKTETFTVKLTPVKEVPVTKGALLVKVEEAQKEVAKTDKYTAESIATLQSAINEARAVLASSAPSQADLNSTGKALDVATAGLVLKDATPTGEIEITSATAAGTTLSGLLGDYTYTVAGTVADATVTEVTLTFTGEDAAKTKTVPVIDKAFTTTISGDDMFGVFSNVEVSYGTVKANKEITKIVR